jgi:mannose-1-phosphate guanylyltransferase
MTGTLKVMFQSPSTPSGARLPDDFPPIAVVIPAGGSGTRLWPRSRRKNPKQLLDIVTPNQSMIQETVARVCPSLTSADRIYVITNASHVDQVRAQLPDTPARNVVGEPMGRDSAPAIALMAALLEKDLGGDAVMIVLAADHSITDIPEFHKCLKIAINAALDNYLVTLGIEPTGPDTGFGYIHRGDEIVSKHGTAHKVKTFREKPDKSTAEHYVSSGEYSWNAGMYVARVSTFRHLFQTHTPEMEEAIGSIIDSYDTENQEEAFLTHFHMLPKISVDFAVAEKAERIAVVRASMGWSDVGSWSRLAEVLKDESDESGNILIGDGHQVIKTTNTFIHSPKKIVAVIGVDNLIIVETDDAILVATKDRAEDVKSIVESLQKQGRHELI